MDDFYEARARLASSQRTVRSHTQERRAHLPHLLLNPADNYIFRHINWLSDFSQGSVADHVRQDE
jgi:hypothetical protein